VKQPGRLSLRFQPADGSPELDIEVFKFKGPGVAMGMYNTDEVGFLNLNILDFRLLN